MSQGDIPKETYEAIEKLISSEESVVGIDAKKTHIVIIHRLNELSRRLDDIEKRLG